MGIILSLLAAFFASLRMTFEKKALKQMDEFVVALLFRFFALLFLLLLVFILGIKFEFQCDFFWKILIIGAFLGTTSSVLVMKALKLGDLSAIGPIGTFSPLFVLIFSPLIVGEIPPPQGIIGVFLIVIGAYILNIKELVNGYSAPVTSLFNKKKGSLYMLGAAFIWSIGANVDKLGVEISSPFVWAVSINTLMVVILATIVLIRGKVFEKFNTDKTNYLFLILAGFVGILMALSQLYAITMILVVYVISLKRLSAIFEVFIGHFNLKEENFKERLIGSLIMVLGAILIVFSL